MPDQDALNAVCSGKIKLIEPRWNIMPSHYFMQLNASGIWETHGKSTNFAYLDTAYNLKTNREEPAIVHMTEIKPWGAFHCYDYTIVPDFTDKNLNNIIEQWMKSALNVKEYQYYFNNLKKFYSEKIFIKEAQQVDFILKNVFKQIKRIKKRNRIKFYLMGLSLVINYMLLIFLLLE